MSDGSKRRLFIITAASGTGKTSLVARLIDEVNSLERVITHTTRPMRNGEKNGIDYHFVTPDEFAVLLDNDAFAEHAKVFGLDYGTSKAEIDRIFNAGHDAIINIDWQGAESLMALYPQQMSSIFLLPPSMLELERRLRNRDSDSEEVIQMRLAVAKKELEQQSLFEHKVINDDFEKALNELKQIIANARQGR